MEITFLFKTVFVENKKNPGDTVRICEVIAHVNVVETEQRDNAEPADDDIDERDVRVEFVEESPGYYTKGKQHHN
jgi:hypothetical protein